MRQTIVSLVLAASLAAVPSVARATNPGEEIAFSALAALSNILYTPAKVVVAASGLTAGALAGFATGGDTRSAYAFWVPSAGGDFFLTPSMMEGRRPVQFFGDDYADRPSAYERTHWGDPPSDAMYLKPSR
jgi:hypothetical protein